MKKDLLINKLYKIIFSVFTIILGLLFILFAFTIYFKGKEMVVDNPNYQIYTREIVGKYLGYLIIPFIVWVLMIISSYLINHFYPIKENNKIKISQKDTYNLLKKRISHEDENYKEQLSLINKERKNRKIIFIVVSIICLIFMIFAARYVFNFDNFPNQDMKKEAVKLALNVVPWVLGAFIVCCGYLIYQSYSIKKELVYIKEILKTYKGQKNKKEIKNNDKAINITRICVLVVSIVFIVVGIFNNGYHEIFVKAVNICSECIGLA